MAEVDLPKVTNNGEPSYSAKRRAAKKARDKKWAEGSAALSPAPEPVPGNVPKANAAATPEPKAVLPLALSSAARSLMGKHKEKPAKPEPKGPMVVPVASQAKEKEILDGAGEAQLQQHELWLQLLSAEVSELRRHGIQQARFVEHLSLENSELRSMLCQILSSGRGMEAEASQTDTNSALDAMTAAGSKAPHEIMGVDAVHSLDDRSLRKQGSSTARDVLEAREAEPEV
ncbi:unnamed protein product [Symbiodinium sp. CCMP2592]|nr:unnamed protein product [Symbiodinium sp. CCMP2592]